MPFKAGEQAEGSVPFKEGEDERRHLTGPTGSKHRSTIARKILEMKGLFKDETFNKIIAQFPEITKESTVEEIGQILTADRWITEGNDIAGRNLLDSAYGAPKQEIDSNVSGLLNIINLGSGKEPDEVIAETGERGLLPEG